MIREFRLEDPGEGIHEAEIREIHVSEGDEVADGDIILTVETDKAVVELPAPFSGVIEEIKVGVDDVARIGEVVMTYRTGDESADKPEQKPESDQEIPDQEEEQQPAAKPKHRRSEDARPVPAAPAARRLARELGIDLRAVEPTGSKDHVTKQDVQAAAEERPDKDKESRKDKAERPEEVTGALPDFSRWGEVERQPLRSIRRATARHMARSWAQIPHVMHQDEADITDLEQWRQAHKSAAEEHGGKLTLTVLVMKALVAVLKAFPRFNASLDTEREEIVLKRHYHIGVAVDTDQGLLVPVVRDADRKSLVELSAELTDLAEKARAGALAREDMQGGTFTITNPGPLGGHLFTPIINHPQAAILGLGQSRLEATVRGDLDDFEIVPRLMLPLCLAFDHRLNDGADAARFTTLLAETLTDTDAILLTT